MGVCVDLLVALVDHHQHGGVFRLGQLQRVHLFGAELNFVANAKLFRRDHAEQHIGVVQRLHPEHARRVGFFMEQLEALAGFEPWQPIREIQDGVFINSDLSEQVRLEQHCKTPPQGG